MWGGGGGDERKFDLKKKLGGGGGGGPLRILFHEKIHICVPEESHL